MGMSVGAAVCLRWEWRWCAWLALLAAAKAVSAGPAVATPDATVAAVRAGAASASERTAVARPAYWRERTSLFRVFAAAQADVVMLGDSLTDGAEWQEIFPDLRIVNRGIDGDTADGVRERLNDVLALQPRAVVLMIGINDLTDGRRSADAVFADVRAIVERLVAAGARVVLMSTLPCNAKLGAWKSCAAAATAVRALNGRLAGLAGLAGQGPARTAYVDLASRLADAAGLRPEYTYDGVHLNGAGYRVWRDAIAGLILADLMPAGPSPTPPAR